MITLKIPAGHLDVRRIALENGTVLVGSDAHIWRGEPTTAMASFLWAARKLKPGCSGLKSAPLCQSAGSVVWARGAFQRRLTPGGRPRPFNQEREDRAEQYGSRDNP
jgi:hypothetical protein